MIKKIILLTFTVLVLVAATKTGFAQDDGTPSATTEDTEDSIRKKIREKVEEVKRNPKAYLGTVTDISEDSLQIKNVDDEIQLISIADEVTYAQINKVTKEASFEDIAIGDFTIVMGYKTDKVLDAKRILITSPIEPPERNAIYGKVSSIVKKQLSLLSSGQEYELSFPIKWKGPEISEIEESMNVIVVYEPDEDELVIRTIEIASTPAPEAEETE